MSDLSRVRELWCAEQDVLAKCLEEHDRLACPLQRLGGFDISFVKGDAVRAAAALVVLDAATLEPVYTRVTAIELTEPYIPGFLAFREVGFALALLDELRATRPELMPDVILVDGNGVLHTRGFGLACHLGVLADIPTVGVGKTFFSVDGLEPSTVRDACDAELAAGGQWMPLRGASGRVWGAALRVKAETVKPVYVSIGHRVSLETAVRLAIDTARYRVPEPIRAADMASRAFLRERESQAADPSAAASR